MSQDTQFASFLAPSLVLSWERRIAETSPWSMLLSAKPTLPQTALSLSTPAGFTTGFNNVRPAPATRPRYFADFCCPDRDVHKSPALDLVGWFTIAPTSGPQPYHLPVHKQLAETYNESILLLAFHPSSFTEASASQGDKLPLTIYETIYETSAEDGDKTMQASGDAPPAAIKFKELPYSVETGDAEMISVDFVARGAGNATAVPVAKKPDVAPKGKGKAKTSESDSQANGNVTHLSTEEEDTIASLTAKANATRMLQQRIRLVKKYLDSLPPCYLNDASITECEPHQQISHPILRSVASLLARLPLLIPFTPSTSQTSANQNTSGQVSVYTEESAAQASDVSLITLLGSLGSTVRSADNMTKKAQIVEGMQKSGARAKGGGRAGDWFDVDSVMDNGGSSLVA